MSLAGDDKEIRNHTPFNNLENPITPRERTGVPINPNSGGSSKPMSFNPRISYRECLKNHAASMGGTVTDGCGEFMPSGEEGTLEALKCAACNCHRNFHRKEHREAAVHNHPQLYLPPPLPSPSVVQPVKIAFGGGGGGGGSIGTESSSEELNFGAYHSNMVAPPPPPPHFSAKKRFRTKFTAEQKEKMTAFAEKLGWRIPREDDSEMQRFCAEVGVKRQVFKVWMHNNKSTSTTPAKKNPDQEF